MLRGVCFLLLLLSGFCGGVYFARKFQQRVHQPQILFSKEVSFYPTAYCKENLGFVIVIVGKNNGAWLEKTLHSALFQNYPNFRIIYVDDGSDDGSFALAQEFVQSQPYSQITLKRNETSLGFVKSLCLAIQDCKDREIVVVLYGEDRLAHEWVLQKLNQYYANCDLWMTYGQYVTPPFYRKNCRAIQKNELIGAFKTFYSSLFQKVRSELELLGELEADTLTAAMFEMAKDHAALIPDVLYVSQKMRRVDG